MSVCKHINAGIAAVLSMAATIACAQTYPHKPIRFISPAAPGGGFDFVCRTVGPKVAEALGQQVLIDNRGGAGGNVGTALASKAAGDGYTIVLAYIGTMAIAPWLYKELGYHPLRDFVHVTHLTSVPLLAVVPAALPVQNIKALAAYAKDHPGKLAFGSAGASSQMTGELFKMLTDTQITHVPYKGAAPATLDLVAGRIAMAFMSPTATTPHVKAGRLRGLAVTGETRIGALPEVPTSREAGYPGLEVMDWYGVSAPAKTPKAVIAKLNAELARALRLPEVKEKLNAAGYETVGNTAEEFTAYVQVEYKRWGEIVRKAGVSAE
ncbi:MAG: tripartite tricarboxylate transporter substrate binding protein [Burkholderiales bacterium]|nr:tripartite tricarboxylate transporter substrate binding protein [Burkholderiales bacterium]